MLSAVRKWTRTVHCLRPLESPKNNRFRTLGWHTVGVRCDATVHTFCHETSLADRDKRRFDILRLGSARRTRRKTTSQKSNIPTVRVGNHSIECPHIGYWLAHFKRQVESKTPRKHQKACPTAEYPCSTQPQKIRTAFLLNTEVAEYPRSTQWQSIYTTAVSTSVQCPTAEYPCLQCPSAEYTLGIQLQKYPCSAQRRVSLLRPTQKAAAVPNFGASLPNPRA